MSSIKMQNEIQALDIRLATLAGTVANLQQTMNGLTATVEAIHAEQKTKVVADGTSVRRGAKGG